MNPKHIEGFVFGLIVGWFLLLGLIFLVNFCIWHIWEYVKDVTDDQEARIKKLEGVDTTEKPDNG